MATIQIFQVNKFLQNAESAAHQFVSKLTAYKAKSARKDALAQESTHNINPFWRIFAPLMVVAGLGLAVYAGVNSEIIFNAIIPKSGDLTDESPNIAAILVAISFTIIGLAIGHWFFERGSFFQRDSITGAVKLNSKFLIGFLAAIFYLGLHYTLAKMAIGNNSEYQSFIYMNLGVALLEMVVGGLFLGKAFYVISIWFLTIGLYRLQKSMNGMSKSCNDNYNFYLDTLSLYNDQHPNAKMEKRGNPNIVKAISYYSGIEVPNEQNNNVHQNSESSLKTEDAQVKKNVTKEEIEDEFEEVFNDNIDDNLSF